MTFSTAQYSRLKTRLKSKYFKDLELILKRLVTYPKFKTAKWMIKHQEEFQEYSPIRWYYLKQIQSALFFLEIDLPVETNEDSLSPAEDKVFERWNQSEFADAFLRSLSRGFSVRRASESTLDLLDRHLIEMGKRHILRIKETGQDYRIQTSLGDLSQKRKLLETTLHFEKKDLVLMTSTLKEMKTFSQKIEQALQIIKRHSPTSWDRFNAFTEVIIPIKQKEFVSYSHQELPGTSMINLYHRDFVDLLDDLLHENGHHHLNYYLNLGKLIEEPLENDYYSPWRRTLRPLRGIYHAYFTFFWAFKLFCDLANAKELNSEIYEFNSNEMEKIYWRAIEEFWMLDYSFKDLKRAHSKGLIHDTGWNLILEQQSELKKAKRKILTWEKKLKTHKKDLSDLKKTLLKSHSDFSRLEN